MYFQSEENENPWKQDASLEVVRTERDGDCLFSALALQLFGNSLRKKELKQLVNGLRTDVVKHIKEHFSSFESDIKNRVYEEENGKVSNLAKNCR